MPVRRIEEETTPIGDSKSFLSDKTKGLTTTYYIFGKKL
jgi:hypothetical protein